MRWGAVGGCGVGGVEEGVEGYACVLFELGADFFADF